ncbi:Outer membrane protein assembly factor BamD, BamD/ComL family [Desulfomicrobium norvegicum]|uniref:Outer membrane protein assembly factor BamD, BamD/ComL family n=1 Tax=Desulfomicrobium norvegicum (strain DSM 1741 / NCIMB 8310) TaxID=52561 RepID=A0A8G2C171_DESNO|nr:Outer membrane protein assembly factor BamD, BamD/ComL family [Desulfomicrobium norvegicum]
MPNSCLQQPVRTRPLASLIWLLVPAILGLIPLHAAHGAVLTWNKLPNGEELVFRFDTALPVAEPRQRGLTQIQIPIAWSFWQNERKPAIPDLSSSKLLKEILISPDGVFIRTQSGDFILSSSSDSKRKELSIELYPPAPPESKKPDPVSPAPTGGDNATDANATTETSPPKGQAQAEENVAGNAAPQAQATTNSSAETSLENATDVDQKDLLAEDSSLSGLASVRSKIVRPGQDQPDPMAQEPPQSVVRRPIDRAATPPDQTPQTSPVDEAKTDAGAPEQLPPASLPSNTTAPRQNATQLLTKVQITEAVTPEVNQTGELPDTIQADITPPEPAPPTATQNPGNENADLAPSPTPSAIIAPETILSEPEPTDSQTNRTANASDISGSAEDNSTAELEELYKTAQTALIVGDLTTARTAVTNMIEHPKIPETLHEELLYTLADITMKEGLADLEGNFASILEAYETAKNSNLDSRNVPEAISRIGYLHLFVGNVPEAKGYFDFLRRKYPDDRRVAMIDYYWGEHYLRRKEYGRAAEHFQYAIQNFPMSLAVQPSTVGLLRAFTGLGYFDKALEIVDNIEKRWPSYYLSDPSFLMSAGYAAMLSGKPARAKDYFWAYANIVPNAPDVDVAMARIGDILLKEDNPDAAREIYHRTSEAYPAREGGLIAKMRLAEEGVLDQPSIADMNPVFSRPESNPEQIYNSILEHADSPLAPVARLKLAMWHLWNKKYAASLEEIRRFQNEHPGHELLPKAREVADTALRDWLTNDLELEDFNAAVLHWGAHENMYQDRDVDPRIRLIVATALMQTGRSQEALDMARPFVFGSAPRGEFSEPGLEVTLAMQVELQKWRDILALSKEVESWNLGEERQRQVDYATALAHEKLEQSASAGPLWTKLATDMGLTDTQRGYAHYFLGRDALGAGRLEQATILGQEALTLLQKEKSDIPKLKETLELLVQAAEKSGRAQDALAWTLEYDGYVDENDADWPAHTYRKALLFKKNSETDKWRENLNRLKELFPNSLHGRMAAAELEGTRIEREVRKFR